MTEFNNATLLEEKSKLISQVKTIVMNETPISPDALKAEVGSCWLFEEFGSYYLNKIVNINEDKTWDAICVTIENESLLCWDCGINPYIDEDSKPCYVIDEDLIDQFIHICEITGDMDMTALA